MGSLSKWLPISVDLPQAFKSLTNNTSCAVIWRMHVLHLNGNWNNYLSSIRIPNRTITVPADVLSPGGARPSGLIIMLDRFGLMFFRYITRFDIMDSLSSFFILTYAIIYVLIHHIIFRLYLYFLNIVLYFFKYSCTNTFHRRSLYTFYSSWEVGHPLHRLYISTFQWCWKRSFAVLQYGCRTNIPKIL